MPLSPIEVLRKVPLFAGLGENDLTAFAELTRERSYPKGSVIVFEDDPGDALYLVAAGQVKVVIIGPWSDQKLAGRVAEEAGARVVLVASSVGAVKGADDYIAAVDYNINTLVKALR